MSTGRIAKGIAALGLLAAGGYVIYDVFFAKPVGIEKGGRLAFVFTWRNEAPIAIDPEFRHDIRFGYSPGMFDISTWLEGDWTQTPYVAVGEESLETTILSIPIPYDWPEQTTIDVKIVAKINNVEFIVWQKDGAAIVL